jgi:ribonuclease VapC
VIVLDTSAIIAMIEEEADAADDFRILEGAVSSVTLFEAALVLYRRRGGEGAAALNEFIASSRAAVHAFDANMIPLALDAHRRFGKGTGARAGLNFGDCISYAVARSLDAPLLYKGDDFAATDIGAAQ